MDANLKEALDYVFYDTLCETLDMAAIHVNLAKTAEEMPRLAIHLRMAISALHGALELCGDRVKEKSV
jgi:hypothetical protein